MADTVIYHNPKCSTSRKTLDLLRDNGLEPIIIIEFLKTPPSRAQSPASGWGSSPAERGPHPLGACLQLCMIPDAGIDVRTAVRKREPLYAELNLADATDDQLLDAMAERPILIERPIDAVREIL